MLGGGFLGQMHQTNKQNREMLKKEKRKPFEKNDNVAHGEREILTDGKKLSDQEREIFLNEIKLNAKKERQKKLRVLIISLVATVIVLLVLYWLIGRRIVDFLT